MLNEQMKGRFKCIARNLGLSLAGAALVLVVLTILSPCRLERISTYLTPWYSPIHTEEQLAETLIAFGRS